MTFFRLLLTLLLLLFPLQAMAEEGRFVPRKLAALYDGRYEHNIRENMIHRLLEMPANRLGYTIDYHDIREPLPELDSNVQGIIIWFHYDPVPQQAEYIAWMANQLRHGKRLVVLESTGISTTSSLDETSLEYIRYINERLGFRDIGTWHPLTHRSRVIQRNPKIVDFERRVQSPLPSFTQTVATSSGESHLRLAIGPHAPVEYADVVVTGPQGGYATSGYVYHEQEVNGNFVTAWYINPFNFLKLSLSPDYAPVPDVTTQFGRRIFYSHIDGDGWNNRTHIEKYRNPAAFSSKVILEEVLRPYADFGFSVGVVAGDMTDECFGSEASRAVARDTLALPNVEAASHTYTHPLYWQFFEDYTPEKEAAYSAGYPKPAGLFAQDFGSLLKQNSHSHQHDGMAKPKPLADAAMIQNIDAVYEAELKAMYDTPRSYNCLPFDEDIEILKAAEVINGLAPEGKKVQLLQWSGNTSPYERFLQKTREAGFYNINGGESRYDAEYPSYSTLYPIGISIGNERQIYSTASNENTYTNLWSERFYGYRYLIDTVRHTEHPMRVAPFNVYFHSYSGERRASLRALQEIMEYARKQELIPLFTSVYAAIANGFYTTRIETLGRHHWRIHDRGALQTLRVPKAVGLSVDTTRSHGVLGQRMWQENLYIFLNPSVDKPEIMLIQKPSEVIPASMMLTSSRWNILAAERLSATELRLRMQGFGNGEMRWRVPKDGTYEATAAPEGGTPTSYVTTSENNSLHLVINGVDAYTPMDVHITLKKTAQ